MSHRLLTIAVSVVTVLGLAACANSVEKDKDDNVFAINPLTGEVKEFPDPDQVPPGWQTCPDQQTCPAPMACENLDEASCLQRPDCQPLYAVYADPDGDECTGPNCGPFFMGCEANPGGGSGGGGGGGGVGPCPLVPQCEMLCPPGTTHPVDPDGCEHTCECVPETKTCDPLDCGPAPGANPQCPDGSSSETVCELTAPGTCGWVFKCP